MKLLIGAGVVTTASLLFFVSVYFGNQENSNAFSSGDYRLVASGNWDEQEIWEVFDGHEWIPAPMPPLNSIRKIVVSANQRLILSDEVVLNFLEIEKGAELDIESNTLRIVKKQGQGGITCNGTLILRDVVIEGDGDILIGSGATLMVGAGGGMDRKGSKGNIKTKGKLDLHKDARYVFNGSIRQRTGNGIPSVLRNLVIDNSSGVEFSQGFTVTGELELINGTVFTGIDGITLGTSSSDLANIKEGSGSVCGKIKSWYNLEKVPVIQFPLSDGYRSQQYLFSCDISSYRKGMIELIFKPALPDDSKRSPYEARHVVVGITENGHYSANMSNGAEEAWLKLMSCEPDLFKWNISSRTLKSDQVNAGSQSSSFTNLMAGPNPFRSSFVVRFHSTYEGTGHISLVSKSGKVIRNEKLKILNGYNQVNFITDSDVPPGAFMLQLSTVSEIVTTGVVKSNQISDPL